jgi:hypothetical protein
MLRVFGVFFLLGIISSPIRAHEGHADAAASAMALVASGTVTELLVENKVTEQSLRYLGLRLDDGHSVDLVGAGLGTVARGSRIEATGVLVGQSFRVTNVTMLTPPSDVTAPAPKALTTLSGTLAIFHKDFFAEGRGEYGLAIRARSGAMIAMNVAVKPQWLEPNMEVTVEGTLSADGASIDASRLTILALPPAQATTAEGVPATNAVTNTVLVIPIRFSDTPAGDPFNAAAINTEFQTHVAPYYQEVSYGQQLLTINVACTTNPLPGCAGKTDANGWLQSSSPTPTNCDFGTMGSLGDAVATAAGYNTSVTGTQFIYYVLPSIPSCGWAGLAYVGWGHAWSNGVNALWVYGHELGHNFGLWHSGSLSCPGQVIGGSCGVSEYGDPFDVMGNIRQGHFNSMQKSKLNWIPASSVKHHTSGTQTYQLSPLESGGKSTYAVTIPVAADPNRTYWVEFRQPIGFDAPISTLPNLGAQIRVSGPAFDYPCSNCGGDDTELLDTTPGSSAGNSGFDDAALLAGLTYTDTYGISVHVVSATTTLLTVQVTAPGASLPPSLAGAVSRKTHGSAGVFDLPLSLVATNPTTEPREGPTHTIVFDFGKPITAATATVTEGTATAGTPTFSGNTVIVTLSGVANAKYITLALSNVTAADGGTGGSGSVRVGFLLGDVNQTRTVTVSDVAMTNTVLTRAVTSSNYLEDVNLSGTLTVADKALITGKLTTALPAP